MRAIIISRPGGAEVLSLSERPRPDPRSAEILIAVKAFGLNRAELHFRSGAWGKVAEISGIECAGSVEADLEGGFAPGQKVIALMGGMGRTRNGSYAEFVSVPRENVVAIDTDLPCWGGRLPTASQCARMSSLRAQSRETVRGTDYSNWYGHVKECFPIAWRERCRATTPAQEAFA
jgi:NADPH:quinone reductase-like Zn-dependent oxidoreductase